MITFTRPGWSAIRKYIDALRGSPVSYSREQIALSSEGRQQHGAAGHRCFRRDEARLCLGRGRHVFDTACEAIRRWRMFPANMAEVFWPSPELEPGYVVAVLFRGPGFWSLNPCRIVDRVEEPRRFGFAYGTLNGHLESGEESFVITWREDESVWYELTAHSRPHHWLAWVGYPIVRREQARFRNLSCQSMKDALA